MAKLPANHGKDWTSSDLSKLRALAAGNTPSRVIGLKLNRTPAAVANKASEERISLAPWNQRPYGSSRR